MKAINIKPGMEIDLSTSEEKMKIEVTNILRDKNITQVTGINLETGKREMQYLRNTTKVQPVPEGIKEKICKKIRDCIQ